MESIVFPTLPTYLFEPSLAGVLSLAVTVILPLVAALLMKRSWSALPKGLILLGFAAVKAFLEAWLGATEPNEVFNAWQAAYACLINFGIAVAAYFGLLGNTWLQQAAMDRGPVKGGAPRPSRTG
jgi:hypothetical protein